MPSPSPLAKTRYLERQINRLGERYISYCDLIIRVLLGAICTYSGLYYYSLALKFNPIQLKHSIILVTLLLFFIDIPRTIIFTKKHSRWMNIFLQQIKEKKPVNGIPVQELWNEATNFPLKISTNLFGTYLDLVVPYVVFIVAYERMPLIEGIKSFIGGMLGITIAQMFYLFSWEAALRPVWRLILATGEKINIGTSQAHKMNLARKMKIGFISTSCISLLLSGTLGYYKLHEAVQAVTLGANPELIISSFTLQSIVIALVTLLVVVALSLLLSHSVSAPLRVMNAGINEVTQGNLDTQIEILSDDELGHLAHVFNNMLVKLKESTEQIQNQNFKLKELDRLKSEFLANTSHELRTPINGITGLVESILDGADGPVNEKVRQHLQMINECGRGLKGIVDNLLDLTKIMVGQGEFRIKKVNLTSLLNLVVPLGMGLLKGKDIKLTTDIAGDLPEVYIDQDKIWQVLMNLLGNAAKFTKQGKIKIGAKLVNGEEYHLNDKGKWVLVSVSDTGIGIRPEDQEVIFEEFRQLDGSASREYGGAGLGLSIARKILERHNCIIWVESTLGKGATFYFTLPAEPQQAGVSTVSEIEPVTVREINPRLEFETNTKDKIYELEKNEKYRLNADGHGETILVVDDNPVNIEVVKTRLELNNYKVIGIDNSLEGLKIALDNNIDLIILDLMMPRMTGYEFCQRVREHSLYIPIIMLTAKGSTGDLVYGLNLGANDYLAKPVNKEELIARVGALLRLRRLQKKLEQTNQELLVLNERLEHKVMERTKALELANNELKEMDRKKSEFLSIVSHELRTPITSIKAFSEILMDENDKDLARKHLDIINTESDRISRLVADLLNLSRLQLGKETFNLTDVNVAQIVIKAKNLVTPLLREKYLTIRENIPENIPHILSDPDKLMQVMNNLLSNAIKYSNPNGNIGINVQEIMDENDKKIWISVTDDGPGIAPEYHEEIFSKLKKVNSLPKGIAHGSGLGLAISREIISHLGGHIWVESTPGKGSTFYFTLPIKSSE